MVRQDALNLQHADRADTIVGCDGLTSRRHAPLPIWTFLAAPGILFESSSLALPVSLQPTDALRTSIWHGAPDASSELASNDQQRSPETRQAQSGRLSAAVVRIVDQRPAA